VEKARIRFVGLTMEKVADFRKNPSSKSGGLYAALDRRYEVIGIAQPSLSRAEQIMARALAFHPDRERWRFRTVLNMRVFNQRTNRAERLLKQYDGKYDLIMQLHTIMSPGHDPTRRRYVLHTDNTYILSDRFYAPWSPLRGKEREAWLARERVIYQNAAFLFPRSEYARRSMIEDYGCDPERVIVVGGGGNFGITPVDGKSYNEQIALFVGFDFVRKGGEVLLKAWEQVRRKLPEAQLWIAGPRHPVREVPGVRWLGTITDRKQLMECYKQATIFVMPSLFEPWGHVFFEAMSFGLPCIGSTCCAMPEIINNGVTGLLAETGEAEPLAEALIALLGDPQRAAHMGQAAQAAVAKGGTWDDVIARMAPFIERAVGTYASVEH
jgi:glycosyltransferase involved in cell wall biosynthesis